MSRDPRDPRQPSNTGDPRGDRKAILGRAKDQIGAAGKLVIEGIFGSDTRTFGIVASAAQDVAATIADERKRPGHAPIEWDFGEDLDPSPAAARDVIDAEAILADDDEHTVMAPRRCWPIVAEGAPPGWGCCGCGVFNGGHRTSCKACAHVRCDVANAGVVRQLGAGRRAAR
jgi:hypothetical protein